MARSRAAGRNEAAHGSRGGSRRRWAFTVTALAVTGGIIVGAVSLGSHARQGWQRVIPLSVVAGGIGGAVVVGVLAGVYPSIRASRLTPTEALAL